MQLHLSGIHVDISEAFRTHVETALQKLNERFHASPIDVTVKVSKPNHSFATSITSHMGHNVTLHSEGEGQTAYASFDAACRHLEERMQRHKDRAVSHQKHQDRHS